MIVEKRQSPPSLEAIIRAVASSTAIETGQQVEEIERQLRGGHAGHVRLSLAIRPAAEAVRL